MKHLILLIEKNRDFLVSLLILQNKPTSTGLPIIFSHTFDMYLFIIIGISNWSSSDKYHSGVIGVVGGRFTAADPAEHTWLVESSQPGTEACTNLRFPLC
jgi:hypothetical protein